MVNGYRQDEEIANPEQCDKARHRYQNQVNVPDVLAATSNFAMSMSS